MSTNCLIGFAIGAVVLFALAVFCLRHGGIPEFLVFGLGGSLFAGSLLGYWGLIWCLVGMLCGLALFFVVLWRVGMLH